MLKTLWKRRLKVTETLRIGRGFTSLHLPEAITNLPGKVRQFSFLIVSQME
jgi:hypothetical protein